MARLTGKRKDHVVVSRLTPTLAVLVTAGGYPLLVVAVLLSAAGLPLPVTALLVAVGVASVHVSGPMLALLCVVCTAAALCGDTLDYLLGRIGAPVLVSRLRPRLNRRGWWQRGRAATWKDHLLATYAARGRRSTSLALFASRFVPPLMPLATPISLLLGASRFALLPFLAWDLLGETVFVVGIVALGRLLSSQLATPGPGSLILWSALMVLGLAPALLTVRWPRPRPRPQRQKRQGHQEAASPVRHLGGTWGGMRGVAPASGSPAPAAITCCSAAGRPGDGGWVTAAYRRHIEMSF